MKCSILGRNNVDLTDKLKEKITAKMQRISRLFDEDAELVVTVSAEKLLHKVEVTIPLKKRVLRAEVEESDLISALDKVVDVVEKQMIKYKNRLRTRSRNDNSSKEEFLAHFPKTELDSSDESSRKIEKTKRFELKPMDAEEAVMEMELLDHNFFVYRNGDTDEVNVVYRRKNGSFGLIEPEF